MNSAFWFVTDGDAVILFSFFLSTFFLRFHVASDRWLHNRHFKIQWKCSRFFSLIPFEKKVIIQREMESYYSLRIQIKSSYDLLMLKIRLLHHHVKHHTWFISLNSALRPSSDSVLHMSPIECTEKSPLFSLISIRFGSCDEVRRLNLALVGREKQQTTKGQKKTRKKI